MPFLKQIWRSKKPFEFFHGKVKTIAAVLIVDVLLLLGIISTAYSAVASHDYLDLFLELIGPVAFGLIGYCLYWLYMVRKNKNQKSA